MSADLELNARAALHVAVSRWFVEDDPSYLARLLEQPELFPGGGYSLRLLRALGSNVNGAVPPAADVHAELERQGLADEAQLLQEHFEASAAGADPALFERALDVLELDRERLLVQEALRALPACTTREDLRGLLDEARGALQKGSQNAAPFLKAFRSLAQLPNVEPPAFAFEGLVYEKTLVLIGGDPGAFKTTLAVSLALGVLTGKSVLGRSVRIRGPVAFLENDMSEGYLAYLFRQLARGMGVALEDDLEHTLHYHVGRELDLAEPSHRARLVREVSTAKPALVVADCLRGLHSLDDNDSKELAPVLDALLDLRDATGAVVLVVDHVVKPERGKKARSAASGYDIRGTGSKSARVDTVLVVRDLGGSSELSCGKQRQGPRFDPLTFRMLDEDETSGGFKLEECERPEEASSAPGDRVREFLEKRAGLWLSLSAVAKGAHVRKEDVPHEVELLFGRRLVEHDVAQANRRKWRWVGSNGSGGSHGSRNHQAGSGSRGSPFGGGTGGTVEPSPRGAEPFTRGEEA